MNKDRKLIEECDQNKVRKFSFKDQTMIAKCVKCYDGDTITVILAVENNVHKFSVRFLGIDCAEIKSSNPEERELGKKARDFLASRILNKFVILKCGEFDKYGRILAEVYETQTNKNEPVKPLKWENSVNYLMLENKYGYKYYGAKRKLFDDWCSHKDQKTPDKQ